MLFICSKMLLIKRMKPRVKIVRFIFFDLIIGVIDQDFKFESKDKARRYFLELTQMFKTWNSIEYDSDEFKQKEKEVLTKIEEGKAQVAAN